MNLTLELLKKVGIAVATVIVVSVATIAMSLTYAVEWLWSLRPTKVLTTEQLRTELRTVAYHVRPYSDDLIKAVEEDRLYDSQQPYWKIRKIPCFGLASWIEIKAVRGAAIRVKVYG